MIKTLILLITFISSIIACAPTYVWRSTPQVETKVNNYFDVEIEPFGHNNRYEAFRLKIKNKTTHDLELDWNKTLYLDKNNTNGGFMFEGIVYKDRNAHKPPDIIFASSVFEKVIWPNNLVEFISSGWYHNPLPSGFQGLYLTIRLDNEEFNEKITVHVSIHRHE